MLTISLKDAKVGFSGLVHRAVMGEFVMITRHGKPVAALVPVAAAEIARKAMDKKRPGLAAYLRTFPGNGFERNHIASRTLDL